MIPKEKINKKIAEIMSRNGLNECFQPIVEEFFYRATDQCNWDGRKLANALLQFSRVTEIKFVNFAQEDNFFKHPQKQIGRTMPFKRF